MAKSANTAVSRGNQDQIRRDAKKRQQAQRKAAALTEAQKKNHRVGFKFVYDYRLEETVAAQKAREEEAAKKEALASACRFGKLVNEQIYAWLDEADKVGFVMLPHRDEWKSVQWKAGEELVNWIFKNQDRYGVSYTPGDEDRLVIAKVKAVAAPVS